MKVIHGTTRMVILVPVLGIVLKFAHFNPIASFLTLWQVFFSKLHFGEKYYWKMVKLQLEDIFMHGPSAGWMPFFWMPILQGFRDNMREFIFYMRYRKSKFLVPTYFSLLGIVNIQQYQKNVCTDIKQVWTHLCKASSPDELMKNSPHTFAESSNFSTDKQGKLKVLDYASLGVQRMVKKYGEQFHSVLITNDG